MSLYMCFAPLRAQLLLLPIMRSSAQGGAKETHQLFGLGGQILSVAPARHGGISFLFFFSSGCSAVGASYLDKISATTFATPGMCSTSAGR